MRQSLPIYRHYDSVQFNPPSYHNYLTNTNKNKLCINKILEEKAFQ